MFQYSSFGGISYLGTTPFFLKEPFHHSMDCWSGFGVSYSIGDGVFSSKFIFRRDGVICCFSCCISVSVCVSVCCSSSDGDCVSDVVDCSSSNSCDVSSLDIRFVFFEIFRFLC